MRGSVELKDIRSFVHIAHGGSLMTASRKTNIPKATLSHNLLRLEDALGVELFNRTSKGLTLTDAGRAYLENCKRIFDSCDMAASAALQSHSAVVGNVRIAATAEFGTSLVGAATLHLSRAYPNLEFEVNIYANDMEIVDRSNFDCLIYIGNPPDSNFMCRKLGTTSYGLYCAGEFLDRHGPPRNVDDIRLLPGVEYTRDGTPEPWILGDGTQLKQVSYLRQFSVNDYWMAKYYAVSGFSIAYLPDFFVHHEVEIGTLHSVLPSCRSREITAWVIYPQARHRNPRVDMVVTTLCNEFNHFIRSPGYTMIPQNES